MTLAHIIRFRIVLCIALPFVLLCGLLAQPGSDRIGQIVSALRNEQYEDALKMLRLAIQQSPGDSQLWTMQGVAYNGLGKEKDALSAFQHAIRLAPDNIPALQGAAQIEFNEGNAAGIPTLKHLLQLHPDDLTSHGMMAILEYQQNNCIAALPHFEKAVTLFESRPPALHAYAACLVKQKQFEKAAEVVQTSLASHPDDAHERRILASIQLVAQHPAEAVATLEPLLNSKPDAQTLELASQAYEQAHETEKAVDALREAILRDPQNVDLYVEFAAISEKHQSVQVGINVVNDGINLQPKAAALYFARGMLYVQLSDYQKAQDDFDTAYTLDPRQSLTAAAQGLTAVQQNDLGTALAGVQAKLRARPADPILLYMQADVLAQQDPEPGTPEFLTAVNSAKKAVALKPALGPAHAVLAKLYMMAGQNPDAVRECRKALEDDPTDQTALYYLIRSLRKTDQKGEIPALLKRLAQMRQQSANKKREENRFKLVDTESDSN
jgi:tetratricopeptide (TPR) repeat protein